jgi:hypothetical protein
MNFGIVLEHNFPDRRTPSNRNEQSRTAKNHQKSLQRNCIATICCLRNASSCNKRMHQNADPTHHSPHPHHHHHHHQQPQRTIKNSEKPSEISTTKLHSDNLSFAERQQLQQTHAPKRRYTK